jgi:branched-subunit amino acid transport protein
MQMLVKNGNVIQINFGNPRIIAGIVAIIVAWKFRNAWLTLVIGMCVLWLFTFI